MATFNQKADFVSNLQQATSDLVDVRGRFLVLFDQYTAQDLGNTITQSAGREN
jgi:RNA-binding protein YhbY